MSTRQPGTSPSGGRLERVEGRYAPTQGYPPLEPGTGSGSEESPSDRSLRTDHIGAGSIPSGSRTSSVHGMPVGREPSGLVGGSFSSSINGGSRHGTPRQPESPRRTTGGARREAGALLGVARKRSSLNNADGGNPQSGALVEMISPYSSGHGSPILAYDVDNLGKLNIVEPAQPETVMDRLSRTLLDLSMVKPTDDEVESAAKVMFFVLALWAIPLVGMMIFFWVQAGLSSTPRAGDYITATAITVVVLTFFAGHAVIRLRDGALSHLQTHVYLAVLEVCWVLIAFSYPAVGVDRGTIMMLQIIVLAAPSFIWVHFVIPLGVIVVAVANEVYDTNWYFPEARHDTIAEHLVIAIALWCSAVLCVLVFFAKTLNGTEQYRQNRSSIAMSTEVVVLLQSYDTNAVRAALSRYRTEKHIDRKLLTAFEAMNANLERYRPHLPNYILMPEDAVEEDEGEVGERSIVAGRSVHSPLQSGSQPPSKHNTNLAKYSPNGDHFPPGSNPHSPGASESGGSAFMQSSSSRHSLSMEEEMEASLHSTSSRSSGRMHSMLLSNVASIKAAAAGTGGGAATGSGGGASRFFGRITMAQLEFAALSLDRKGDQLPRLVDAVYSQATACHASVHSMVGDSLLLSWNATHRVAHGEVKAARFLHKVNAYMKEYGVSASGAACTGTASCELIAASTGQHAFLVHCRWRQALQTLASLAARSHSILLDEQTNSVASYEYESRAIDQLTYFPPSGSSTDPEPHLLINQFLFNGGKRQALADANGALIPSHNTAQSVKAGGEAPTPFLPTHLPDDLDCIQLTVYELLEEAKHQEDDDEWMYQLQTAQNKKSVNSDVTRALQACLNGSYGEAVSLLTQALDGPRGLTPSAGEIVVVGGHSVTASPLTMRAKLMLVENLREYAERQLTQFLGQAPAAVAFPPGYLPSTASANPSPPTGLTPMPFLGIPTESIAPAVPPPRPSNAQADEKPLPNAGLLKHDEGSGVRTPNSMGLSPQEQDSVLPHSVL